MGSIDSITTNTYDEAGNQTSESYDREGDGTPDSLASYTYDAAGNKTSEFYDFNVDGVIDTISTFVYNGAGKLTSSSYDGNGDGIIDSGYTATYDTTGNLTKSFYFDSNGTQNNVNTYTYDAAGNQTSAAYDINGDGIFNAAFQPFSIGAPDYITRSTYDAVGNQTSLFTDYADSNPGRLYLYTYDTAGNQTSAAYDYNSDGVVETIDTYTYDTAGNQTSVAYDRNGDGVVEAINTYTYDTAGNRTSVAYDRNGDGVAESTNTYTYDAAGNQTRESIDDNGDGIVDKISTTLYASALQALDVNIDAKDDAIAAENDILSTGNLFANNGNGADGDLQDGFIRVTQVNGVAVSAVTRITLLSGAVVTVAPNGQFVYDPNGKFDLLAPSAAATDSFTYSITDINGATDSATANVTIKGAVIPTGSGSFPRQVVTDVNGDGLPDSIKTNTYDNAGNLIGESEDSNGDGRIDSISAYAYNAEGYEISSARDFSRNGQFDYFTTSTYTFDEQNNLTREISVDSFGTGVVDRIYAYTFNTNGQEIRETIDYGANGSLENITTTTYDTAGNRTEFYDANGDGIVNQVTTYNATGYEISSARDFSIDLNRELDYFTTSTYTWDEQGNLTREISVDSFGTGVVDTIFTYTFDTSGQQIQATIDYGADGILEGERKKAREMKKGRSVRQERPSRDYAECN